MTPICRAGSTASIVRGARGGRAGRPHDRPARTEARAAAPVGAAPVVGGARRVCGVHALRSTVQRVQRARRRAPLHAAGPAARCRRLLTARGPG